MNLGQVEEGFYTSQQLTHDAFAALAKQGVKTIINNRPDGEGGFYPSSAEAEKLAKENGMEYRYVPVPHNGLTMETIDEFSKAAEELPAPRVAYCASAYRSTMMWALSNAARKKDADEIINACAQRGFNFASMRPTLMQLAGAV